MRTPTLSALLGAVLVATGIWMALAGPGAIGPERSQATDTARTGPSAGQATATSSAVSECACGCGTSSCGTQTDPICGTDCVETPSVQ